MFFYGKPPQTVGNYATLNMQFCSPLWKMRLYTRSRIIRRTARYGFLPRRKKRTLFFIVEDNGGSILQEKPVR